MIILKPFPCGSKIDLLLEEDKIIREMKAIMNQKQSYGINWENRIELKKQYSKEKMTCECGCIISRNYFNQHQQTEKHLEIMKK